jgi:hypothetical protein
MMTASKVTKPMVKIDSFVLNIGFSLTAIVEQIKDKKKQPEVKRDKGAIISYFFPGLYYADCYKLDCL